MKTLKTAEFKRTKKCCILSEIPKSVIEISDQTLINQYLQKCSAKITSGLRVMAANKVLNQLTLKCTTPTPIVFNASPDVTTP